MAPRKRLLMIGSLVLVAGALLTLVFTSFTGSLVYFHTPSEIMAKSQEMAGRKVRIGGMVQEGSLFKEPGTMKMHFLVTDGNNHVKVQYEGMVPDLFREGQGAVVEGVWQAQGEFQAHTILAKHSEDYVPVEMSQQGMEKSRESIMKSMK
ncbi:MAG: cytochrome c maturation protein CcmE [Magnetococcales bacterium]|nr:cytochrome c maturation protein CcmE [Magnetococcales bacterium]NGZ26309.1 cytochrome c maturation protein CcmE [Magnetococcales bacterium]